MSYLLDTNILSESIKRNPSLKVVVWLEKNEKDLYTTTITIGEIKAGIEHLDNSDKKQRLQIWLKQITKAMQGRILSFNLSVANVWGQLVAELQSEGITMPVIDGQIAAIAKRHKLKIVSRNVSDFKKAGIKVINPF